MPALAVRICRMIPTQWRKSVHTITHSCDEQLTAVTSALDPTARIGHGGCRSSPMRMLLASIALVGPALARIARWSVFGGEDGPFVPIVFLGLLAVLIAYDIVSARRPHRATLIGCGGIVLALIAAQLIAHSEFGLSVVRMIG